MKTHYPYASGILEQARRLALVLMVACAALTCVPAWAAPGNTAWTSIYDPAIGEPTTSVMTVSGAIAYAARSDPYNGEPSSNADIRLRAFDIPTGALLWENVWAASGADDSVSDIAASGGRVFIAGTVGSNSYNFQPFSWAVRGYAGNSGTVLWEDRCPIGHASKVIATQSRVYVAGNCSTGTSSLTRVRAYAAATGKLRWEIKIPVMYAVFAIALAGDKLLVTGIDDYTGESLLVRAYGVARGNLLWQRRPELPQGTMVSGAYLAANDSVAYVAWWAGDGTGAGAVVAYETTRGRLRWQSYVDDVISGLALTKGWLYVAKAGGESMVSAYAASSGLLLWQDHPGTPTAPCRTSAVTIGGNQVFVAGSAYHPLHESASNFLVRAYTLDGKLLWADDVPTQALYPANVEGIGWSGGFTVMSGSSGHLEPPYGSTFWQVQGYFSPSLSRR